MDVVIDCKYKEIDDYPGHSDVYQLLAHAESLGSATAVLVYPGEAASLKRIGTTLRGLHLYVAHVQCDSLRADVAEVMRALG